MDRLYFVHLRVWLTLILIGLLISACNSPVRSDGELAGSANDRLATQEQPLEGDEPVNGAAGSPDDLPIVPLECPEDDEKATLEFNHDITFGVPQFYELNVKANGAVLFNLTQSIVDHDPTEKVGIHVIQPAPVAAQVTATIEDCVQAYETTLTFVPTVRGTCIDGRFDLRILEAWQETKVTVICDNEDTFDIPLPFGIGDHKVSGAIGEIASAEKTFVQKFSGMGGSGQWEYSISYWHIP